MWQLMHGINICYRYFGTKTNLLYNHNHKTYLPYFTAMIRSYSSKYQLLVSLYIFVHWMITSKISRKDLQKTSIFHCDYCILLSAVVKWFNLYNTNVRYSWMKSIFHTQKLMNDMFKTMLGKQLEKQVISLGMICAETITSRY